MLCLIDPKKCVAHKTNPLKVKNYQKALQVGAVFPPIEVVEHLGWFYVLDGAHRVAAHMEEGEILAFVFEVNDCPKLHLLGMRFPKGL